MLILFSNSIWNLNFYQTFSVGFIKKNSLWKIAKKNTLQDLRQIGIDSFFILKGARSWPMKMPVPSVPDTTLQMEIRYKYMKKA